MKIYTKGGDQGETALFGGRRVSKSDIRIDSYGTIDELNSWIGLLAEIEVNNSRKVLLRNIQDRLFTIGSELAADPEKPKLKKPDLYLSDVELLEQSIDEMEAQLPPLTSFILPGGHPAVAQAHIARCVCRRAERLIVALHQSQPVNSLVLLYMNRLSDYLFVLARCMTKELNSEEVRWQPRME
jgi:cob(I)alamin adenosyltransferase